MAFQTGDLGTGYYPDMGTRCQVPISLDTLICMDGNAVEHATGAAPAGRMAVDGVSNHTVHLSEAVVEPAVKSFPVAGPHLDAKPRRKRRQDGATSVKIESQGHTKCKKSTKKVRKSLRKA